MAERPGASVDAVVAAELRSLKSSAVVYEKRAPHTGLFFLTTREAALANVEERRRKEAAKRQEETDSRPPQGSTS